MKNVLEAGREFRIPGKNFWCQQFLKQPPNRAEVDTDWGWWVVDIRRRTDKFTRCETFLNIFEYVQHLQTFSTVYWWVPADVRRKIDIFVRYWISFLFYYETSISWGKSTYASNIEYFILTFLIMKDNCQQENWHIQQISTISISSENPLSSKIKGLGLQFSTGIVQIEVHAYILLDVNSSLIWTTTSYNKWMQTNRPDIFK